MGKLPYKVTIGEKTFWHQKLRDGVALITTDNDSIKRVLCLLNDRFPTVVQMMYDGPDADNYHRGPDGEIIPGVDMEGTTTFFINPDRLRVVVTIGTGELIFQVILEAGEEKENE